MLKFQLAILYIYFLYNGLILLPYTNVIIPWFNAFINMELWGVISVFDVKCANRSKDII